METVSSPDLNPERSAQIVIGQALDTLLDSVRAHEVGDEFADPTLEFFCEAVIRNASNPTVRSLWADYREKFGMEG